MTHKPNRVHKATGIIAKWNEKQGYYESFNDHDELLYIYPKYIVEGEGWKDEESKIVTIDTIETEIINMLNLATEYKPVNFDEVNRLIIEFAKLYKEEQK